MLKAKNLFVASGIEQARKEPAAVSPKSVLEAESSEASSNEESPGMLRGLLSKIKSKTARKKKTEPPQMSFALASLSVFCFCPGMMTELILNRLVYTVGVKCRGFGKSTSYSPEHIFSLSENAAGKYCGSEQFIHHSQTHLVRTYPRGTRVSSSNYLPRMELLVPLTSLHLIIHDLDRYILGWRGSTRRDQRSDFRLVQSLILRFPRLQLTSTIE